jgi:uncharacterized protein YodC (DUF2158 family)
MDFKIDDIVTLKSGGPAMIVSCIMAGSALCNWFDAGGHAHKCWFIMSNLKPYQPFHT